MATVTKADLAVMLHREIGLSKKEAATIVQMFFDEICDALANSDPVKLSGFASFHLRDKRERPGRNPKSGEEVTVSARRVVTFKPGMKLKSTIKAGIMAQSD